MEQLIKELQPLLTLIGTVINFAILGIIISIVTQRVEAFKERHAVTEERRLKEVEERQRIERERDELKEKLRSILNTKGITTEYLVTNPDQKKITSEITEIVSTVVKELNKTNDHTSDSIKNSHLIALANASSISGDFLSAAKYYDRYLKKVTNDWKIYMLQAIAYANSRKGKETNLLSLQSYSNSIVFLPKSINRNIRARIYTYRGAMLKRLGRLEESLTDLSLAQKWATSSYEKIDNYYNQACVYAMQKNKDCMIKYLKMISSKKYKLIVAFSEYFKAYRKDDDFLSWINS